MDSFEVNKIIGALLGVIFVIFSVSLLSDSIFASPEPEKPGYAIEAMEGAGGEAAPKEEEVEDIRPMLAKADPEKGAAIFKRCAACHTDDQSGANKVGPNLWGVVDRPIASHEGFSYSSAIKEFSQGGKEHWTYDHLNHFIHNPKKTVPGTAMGFAGLPKAEDRANVIAYLRTQSDKPFPLPTEDELAKIAADKKGGEQADAKAGDEGKAEGADKGADDKGGADKGADDKGAADKTDQGAAGDKASGEGAAGEDKAAPANGNGDNAAPAGQQDNGGAAADQNGAASGDAGKDEGNATEGAKPQSSDQNAPAAESSTTQPGTSGGEAPAKPDAESGDQPAATAPDDAEKPASSDTDSTPRKEDDGPADDK